MDTTMDALIKQIEKFGAEEINAPHIEKNSKALGAYGAAMGKGGLGAMGEPMCKNLLLNGKEKVIAYDLKSSPLARLEKEGIKVAKCLAELCMESDTIFLSLPSLE